MTSSASMPRAVHSLHCQDGCSHLWSSPRDGEVVVWGGPSSGGDSSVLKGARGSVSFCHIPISCGGKAAGLEPLLLQLCVKRPANCERLLSLSSNQRALKHKTKCT